MSADTRQVTRGEAWVRNWHTKAMGSVDAIFGSFCAVMCVLAFIGWRQGTVSGLSVVALTTFWLINEGLTVVTKRNADIALTIERARIGLGLLMSPLVVALVDGPLAPFWPASVVMLLGGVLLLGITGHRLIYSYLLVLGHVAMFSLTVFLVPPRTSIAPGAPQGISWIQLVILSGSLGLIGTIAAQLVGLLSEALDGLRQQSQDLTKARDSLFAELSVAHEIQTLLLPKDPEVAGSEVRGTMVPAAEVGGDYYDVIQTVGGRSFLAMGDVSGHGLTSGLLMMMARTALLGILEARPDIDLVEAYRHLNRCLRHNLSRMNLDMYMTFVLMESKGGGRFEAVGQHLPILVYRAESGKVDEIELEGVWLGMVDELTPEMLPRVELTLKQGDLLVLYTDGVVEHFAGREMFGFRRFKELVREQAAAGPAKLIETTLARLKDFSGDQKDDVTLLVLNHTGEARGGRRGVTQVGPPGEPRLGTLGMAAQHGRDLA